MFCEEHQTEIIIVGFSFPDINFGEKHGIFRQVFPRECGNLRERVFIASLGAPLIG